MKKRKTRLLILLLCMTGIIQLNAQTSSSSSNLSAQAIPDRTVPFSVSDPGVSTPITWGLDLAWLSEANVLRGMAFMGKERIGIIRSSFTPTSPLINGELPQAELATVNKRIGIINLVGENMNVVLNCDHPSVHDYFKNSTENWAALIDVTARLHEEAGHTVVTVSPFNEPDYGWGQGSMEDFYNIAGELKKKPRFENIRISGGNTLSCDAALNWYNYLKDRLDEGNTHQLSGSFDNYANFFTAVRANGHHATNDELHNVMEAMVGAEYGMQTGIWWGTAELARGEFVKASFGERLAYAEHRPNWTAASVYRSPEGKVQAFGGTSERQAATTIYRFVSKDRDVYFDGYGPQREYIMALPGGTGYMTGQTNAEKMVNITWGDDIQPVIDGQYVIVNRNSGLVMEVVGGERSSGSNINQNEYTKQTHQQWDVKPVDTRIGGDFSYFTFAPVHADRAIDVFNSSLDSGGNIRIWDHTQAANQQWYLEYAEEGWFYIRNRHSSHCIEVAEGSKTALANIHQGEKNGGTHQQWRFLPVNATIKFVAPNAPANLTAIPQSESIRLEWNSSAEEDVTGYTIFRSTSAGGPYNTIARNISSTSFIDNKTIVGENYFYVVKAVDSSLNRSDYSNEVTATPTGEKGLVAHFKFDGNFEDSSIHLNHSASYGRRTFVDGVIGKAISLDGSNNFIQLPTDLVNKQEITIASWVSRTPVDSYGELFSFGNDENEVMSLSPRTSSGKLQFKIASQGVEHELIADPMPRNEWAHVAVTLAGSDARMYVNGELVAESNSFTINPLDFKPVLNYIGRNQSITLFTGLIDDFRVYNYALSGEEIAAIVENALTNITEETYNSVENLSVWPVPASDILNINYMIGNKDSSSLISIYNVNGEVVMNEEFLSSGNAKLDVSSLPSGIYIVRISNKETSLMKKIVIQH